MSKSKNASSTIRKPSGGSALKQLKGSLKSLGLIGAAGARAGKKRGSSAKAKGTRSEKEERAEKRKILHEKPNPFELKYNRQKQDVLGRKVKGAVGRPGVSRKRGHDLRKETLLPELQNKARTRTGELVDRRIGESDPNMTVEEKMLERFAREKQTRLEKGRVYNLESDQDDDEDGLTHFGQSLAALGEEIREHDPRLDGEEDAAEYGGGTIDKYQVNQLHFGGGDQDGASYESTSALRPGEKKPYKEIVKEIMAKSKFHKLERQKTKMANEELTRELNDEFRDISQLLFSNSEQLKEQERAAQRAPKPSLAAVITEETANEDDGADDYDKFVKELVNEKRARPTDRTKTEEELAREEAVRLQELERQRIRRMQKQDGSEDGMSEDGEHREVGGDDLGVNFALDGESEEDEEEDDASLGDEGEALTYRDGVLVNGHKIFMKPKQGRRDDLETGSASEEDDEEWVSEEDGETDGDEDGDEYDRDAEKEQNGSDSEQEETAEIPNAVQQPSYGDKAEFSDEYFTANEFTSGLSVGEPMDDHKPLTAVVVEEEQPLESGTVPMVDFSDVDFDEKDDDGNVREEHESESEIAMEEAVAPSNKKDAKASLPYTFLAPATYLEFLALMKERTLEQQATIVQRLRVLYHISLAAENKGKLQKLLLLLLTHVETVACFLGDRLQEKRTTRMEEMEEALTSVLPQALKSNEELMAVVDTFFPAIHELALQFPEITADHFRKRLNATQKVFLQRPVGAPVRKPLIALHELMMVLLVGRLFPTSDFHHPVVTPVYLFMGQCLTAVGQHAVALSLNGGEHLQASMLKNIATGLILCQIWIQFQGDSKRYLPEVAGYLSTMLCLMVDRLYPGLIQSQCASKTFPFALPFPLASAKSFNAESSSRLPPASLESLLEMVLTDLKEVADAESSVLARSQTILTSIVSTLATLADMYLSKEETSGILKTSGATSSHVSGDSLDDAPVTDVYVNLPSSFGWCWTEVFEPCLSILAALQSHVAIDGSSLMKHIQQMQNFQQTVHMHRQEHCKKLGHAARRVSLQWQKKRAQAIRLYTPKFQDNFNPDRRSQDPNQQRAELQKTKSLHRKEMKGAIRELRKDAAFLSTERVKEKREADVGYQKKMKRVYGLLGNEQGERNAEERAVRRIKKK